MRNISLDRIESLKALPYAALIAAAILFHVATHTDGMRWFKNQTQDFTGFFVGAELVGTPDLYDSVANMAAQTRLGLKPAPAIIFMRLPYFAAALKPLTRVPYHAALLLWKALELCCIAGFVAIFPYRTLKIRAMLACWYAPSMDALIVGQDSPMVLLWLGIAFYLLRRRSPLLAGIALSLCCEKWHLILLVPIAIIAKRQWRLFGGFAAGSTFLLLISLAIQGPGFPVQYWRALTNPVINAMPVLMPNAIGVLTILGLRALYPIALLSAIPIIWAFRKQPLEISISLALIAGLLLNLHDYLHDWLIALPALILIGLKCPPLSTPVNALLLPIAALPLIFGYPIGSMLMVGVACHVVIGVINEKERGPDEPEVKYCCADRGSGRRRVFHTRREIYPCQERRPHRAHDDWYRHPCRAQAMI